VTATGLFTEVCECRPYAVWTGFFPHTGLTPRRRRGQGFSTIQHVGVTDTPTDAWTAQQLRKATPLGEGPKYLVRDNDSKFGAHFAAVAAGAGIKQLKTPIGAPNANAVIERFLGSVRRECLDHILVLSVPHLYRVIKAYVAYFDTMRPHQGMGQRVPALIDAPPAEVLPGAEVRVRSVLGGLHHSCERAA
jgi:putative transposase